MSGTFGVSLSERYGERTSSSSNKKSKYVEYVTPEFIQFDKLSQATESSNLILSSLVEYALSIEINPITCIASILNSKLTFPEDRTYLEGLAIENNLKKD